jgi:hypothetical protein
MSGPLASWTDGDGKRAIVEFVELTVSEVPVEERVAVFDNDGTLWCEKPLPIQADFILRRLLAMAEAEPELRERQPWKAAYERDYAWLGTVMAEHYAGDDTNVPTLLGGVLEAFAGITVDDFEAKSDAFLRSVQHPTLGRRISTASMRRWSSCSTTSRRTGSRTTSPRAVAVTSCARSATRSTAFRVSG